MKTSSAASETACFDSYELHPGTAFASLSADDLLRLATATTGKPFSFSPTARAVPTFPAPMKPTFGRVTLMVSVFISYQQKKPSRAYPKKA